MAVFDEGYPYKIVARLGVSTDIPILIPGEIGYDLDTKTFRVGDGTTEVPKIPSTKSVGTFTYASANIIAANFNVITGGTVCGLKLNTLNQNDGFVVRKANGEFRNVEFISGDGTLSVTNPTGVNGNVDIRLSPALANLLLAGGFLSQVTHNNTLTGLGTVASPLSVTDSTESQKGAMRIATQLEASAGIVDDAALTPESIANIDPAGATALYLTSIIQTNLNIVTTSSFSGSGRTASPLDIIQATTSLKGGVTLATQSQVNDGSDANKPITPATLKNLLQGSATATALATALGVTSGGIVRDSTLSGSGITGSPLSVVQATSGQRGAVQLATTAEVEGSTESNKPIVPFTLKSINENSTMANTLRGIIGITLEPDTNLVGLDNRGTTTSRLKIKQATETAIGGARFASVAVVQAGNDSTTMLSPYNLRNIDTASAMAISLGAIVSPNLVSVANSKFAQMAAFTIKANANGTSATPQDISPTDLMNMMVVAISA